MYFQFSGMDLGFKLQPNFLLCKYIIKIASYLLTALWLFGTSWQHFGIDSFEDGCDSIFRFEAHDL